MNAQNDTGNGRVNKAVKWNQPLWGVDDGWFLSEAAGSEDVTGEVGVVMTEKHGSLTSK